MVFDQTLTKAKEEFEVLKAETANLQALKGQDDSLKASIQEQQESFDVSKKS